MTSTRILVGDALTMLRTLPAGSARTCVTSPPYWGLRDYGTASWAGGDASCDHKAPARGGRDPATSGKQLTSAGTLTYYHADACPCGATRTDSQLGLEATPALYVASMVEVFREVRRVLADDGTLWLNLGDSYAGSWGAQGRDGAMATRSIISARQIEAHPKKVSRTGSIPAGSVIKPKDLCGIPWRVAFALQADGWYLRSDIIWAKPNPMPESIRDRPTKSHEYLFLLSKRERYFYDADAIAEPSADPAGSAKLYEYDFNVGPKEMAGAGRPGAERNTPGPKDFAGTRNRRTVWTVATRPFSGAHFATMPPGLVEPCVLAGSALGDTVLDPFSGAGTTGVVASRLGRDFVGVELNPAYATMARNRIEDDAPLFFSPAE